MPKYYSPTGNFEVWGTKPSGYYTEEEWSALHPPTPYVPTKAEKLAALDAQYDADKAEIMRYFATAVFAEDADAQADLRAEMAAIDAQYETDRAAIEQEAD